MAEFVQRRLEAQIPEFTAMEKCGLFERKEIRAVEAQRKRFEYKTQRRTKSKVDFLRYIEYEVNFLELIKARRTRTQNVQKKNEIDYAIANRVSKLYQSCHKLFPGDIDLWFQHIQFCTNMNRPGMITRLFRDMMKIHAHNPKVWISAAKWEFEENHADETARQYLIHSLRHHPHSEHLHSEAFRLELLVMERLLKRREVLGITSEEAEESPDPVLQGQTAMVIYSHCLKNIPKADFLVQLLKIAKQFSFTKLLQDKMLKDLEENFSQSPILWDIKAQLELEKCVVVTPPEPDHAEGDTLPEYLSLGVGSGVLSLLPAEQRLMNCCTVYEEGTRRIPTEEMWDRFLEKLFQLKDDGEMAVLVKQPLLAALEQAHNAQKLSAALYIQWFDHFKFHDTSCDLLEISKSAVEKYPKNHLIWLERVKLNCLAVPGTRTEENVLEVFKESVNVLGDTEDVVQIWEHFLGWLKARKSRNVESVYSMAINRKHVVSVPLKVSYLKWICATKDISVVRKMYDKHCNMPPFSCEFHFEMAEAEMAQETFDFARIRKCYECAVKHFGTDREDTWLKYIIFEDLHGSPVNVGTLHWRGKKTLKPELIEKFSMQLNTYKMNRM